MDAEHPELKADKSGFVKKVIVGAVIGAAAIAPGLNGGVLASAAGIYEPAVRAIVSLRKDFRRSFAFLLPLAIGAGVGFFLFAIALKSIMLRAQYIVIYVFIGLVIGSLPSFITEANSRGFRWRYLIGSAAALAAVIAAGILGANAPIDGTDAVPQLGVIATMAYGAILAVGTVIPGISASFILMYLGVFDELLAALSRLDFKVLLPMGLGFLLMAAAIIRLVEALFRRFHGAAYYTVLGFLIGSMIIVFPGLRTGWLMAADLSLLLGSAALSYIMMRLHKLM
ncbi:MAG: undecaprenyl phosphate translocase family protein [Saccharofermentanales bacterium]